MGLPDFIDRCFNLFRDLLNEKNVRKALATSCFLAGIATCFATGLSCVTTPVVTTSLYSIYPAEVMSRLNITQNGTHTFNAISGRGLPSEWIIGFSGICEDTRKCHYGYVRSVSVESLISLSINETTSLPHRGKAAKENHMFRAAAAFLIVSLLLSAVTFGFLLHSLSISKMSPIAYICMILDIGFITGTQLLQIYAGLESRKQIGRPDIPNHFGPGTRLLWAGIALKAAGIPDIMDILCFGVYYLSYPANFVAHIWAAIFEAMWKANCSRDCL